MIPSASPRYRDALARPHRAYVRVEVWRDGIKVEELAQNTTGSYTYAQPVFSSGQVRVTYSSRVTRVLTLVVPDFLYPWNETDLLAPYGNELHVWRGIEYGDGSVDEFPVFRGPITKPTPGQGRVTIEASDRAYWVVACGFSVPTASNAGADLVDEIERLILEAVPDATFGTHDTFTETVPSLAYDADRGAALDNLCKTADAVWYALADGSFVVRRAPWTAAVAQAPIALSDGDGGTLFSAYPNRSVEGVYNRITVTSERGDGSPAMYATAEDSDPTSPIYVGGPFRARSTQVRVTGAVSQDQLYRAARALLRRSRARVTAWQYTMVPDASLELGDLIESSYREHVARQYIAGFVMPLDVDGKMSLDGRDLLDTEVDQ